MGQGDCLEYLEKVGYWVTTRDIAKDLGIQHGTVATTLKKLYWHGDIERRELKHGYEWKCK